MDHPQDEVRTYHGQSKHHLHRYAPGPEGLDWDSQPDPFRTWAGAQRLQLPLLDEMHAPSFCALYQGVSPAPMELAGLAGVLELALGLAAWKRYGHSRWALRCNPSSGNLHPTEGYVISAGLPGLPAGVWHYHSRDHALERRCTPTTALPMREGVLLGLSSIHWREAWKYGLRAWRYCQLDAGHALAALRYAAAVFGWRVQWLPGWSDADIARLLGTDRAGDFGDAEREQVEMLVWLTPGNAPAPGPALADLLSAGRWQGRASRLGAEHPYHWPGIEAVSAATVKPATTAEQSETFAGAPLPCRSELPAAALIRQRRSAQGFDGITALPVQAFFRMLDMLLPRPGVPPWDALPGTARIHPVLLVHRVAGLRPGLYALGRRDGAVEMLRRAMRNEFLWQPVEGCPAHLDLRLLVQANTRRAAATLACHQAIAADSAFAVAMLAEFDTVLTESGPWGYRKLYWEAGMLGQVLYLEAEAAGMRGTGIGCFFDDAVHETLGITGSALQSLYHFTVGAPVIDTRLETLPGYERQGTL